ncbi:MAG TPA: sarcosine oxidase subunit gamma family protein [Actinomycetes bacterium]|nr:sarcosine oxidase subunit gamma family protein [Actinomycetes bacterium]
MADAFTIPVARSPVAPAAPVVVMDGWEVSGRRSTAPLRLVDCTPLAKVLVRADPDGPVARHLGVGHGRSRRDRHGTLVVGSGPDEWLLLAPPGTESEVAERVRAVAARAATGEHDPGLVSVVELFTHGRALMRLTGADAPHLLAKVCSVDFADRVTPDGTAFRSSVAKVATDVVRDDRPGAPQATPPGAPQASSSGTRSYLLHCERSSGQYLFDAILDAGREFGIEPDGFTGTGSRATGSRTRRSDP